MSRRAYVITFWALAFTFVPVFFSSFVTIVSFVGPCSYVAFVTASNSISLISKGQWEVLPFEALNVLELGVYVGIFYLVALLTFRVSDFAHPAAKTSFQIVVLLLLISCSFLKVIQGSSFVNWTGAYDFWSACSRFLETY